MVKVKVQNKKENGSTGGPMHNFIVGTKCLIQDVGLTGHMPYSSASLLQLSPNLGALKATTYPVLECSETRKRQGEHAWVHGFRLSKFFSFSGAPFPSETRKLCASKTRCSKRVISGPFGRRHLTAMSFVLLDRVRVIYHCCEANFPRKSNPRFEFCHGSFRVLRGSS